MHPDEALLCDAPTVARLIADLADLVAQGRKAGSPLALIGIRSRGVPIAERMAEVLRERIGEAVPVGAVDITLYRDDLGRGDRWPVLKGTEIPFAIDGVEVVLVDDVLFTGRTVRAAMNCVCDLGRPSAVRLAVLADRGGRELPIRADYVGLEVATSADQRVTVHVRPIDADDAILRSSES